MLTGLSSSQGVPIYFAGAAASAKTRGEEKGFDEVLSNYLPN